MSNFKQFALLNYYLIILIIESSILTLAWNKLVAGFWPDSIRLEFLTCLCISILYKILVRIERNILELVALKTVKNQLNKS